MNSDKSEEKQRLAERVSEGLYEVDYTAKALGISIDAIGPGSARGAMIVRKDMLNSHGTCHGGMIFTLADTVFAYACNSENKATVALSCTIDYAKPAQLGERLVAEGARNFRNSRTGTYDITVTKEDGTIVALFRGGSYQVNAQSVPGLNERLEKEDN
ncbi:MAG: hydroxyphenylacetyl-CoA thioesterase PaaI [Rhodospirillales bacterium]|nr:hydroxyphenylacetyl-CoA thioesterase PaaI [Rhodospirillales bacterium]